MRAAPHIGHKRQANRIEMHFELQHNNLAAVFATCVCVCASVCASTLHLAMHTHLRPLSINGECERGRGGAERERGSE